MRIAVNLFKLVWCCFPLFYHFTIFKRRLQFDLVRNLLLAPLKTVWQFFFRFKIWKREATQLVFVLDKVSSFIRNPSWYHIHSNIFLLNAKRIKCLKYEIKWFPIHVACKYFITITWYSQGSVLYVNYWKWLQNNDQTKMHKNRFNLNDLPETKPFSVSESFESLNGLSTQKLVKKNLKRLNIRRLTHNRLFWNDAVRWKDFFLLKKYFDQTLFQSKKILM